MSKKDKARKGFPALSAGGRPAGFGIKLGQFPLHPEAGVSFGMTQEEFVQYLRDAFGAENVSFVAAEEASAQEIPVTSDCADVEPGVSECGPGEKDPLAERWLRQPVRIDGVPSADADAPLVALAHVREDCGGGEAIACLVAHSLLPGRRPLRIAMSVGVWRSLGRPTTWNGVPVRVEGVPPRAYDATRKGVIGWVGLDCRPGEWLDMTNGQRAWFDGGDRGECHED